MCDFCYYIYHSLILFADHETAIMHRLQTVVLEHTKVLMDVMDCCAELDW